MRDCDTRGRNGAWLRGRVLAVEHLADIVKPDTRVVPSNGRVMTGAEIVQHRDMFQTLFKTMIGYLNASVPTTPSSGIPSSSTRRVRRSRGVHLRRAQEHEITYVPD
jgi:hypothetical protein